MKITFLSGMVFPKKTTIERTHWPLCAKQTLWRLWRQIVESKNKYFGDLIPKQIFWPQAEIQTGPIILLRNIRSVYNSLIMINVLKNILVEEWGWVENLGFGVGVR